jgi:hypothetical protein
MMEPGEIAARWQGKNLKKPGNKQEGKGKGTKQLSQLLRLSPAQRSASSSKN